MTVIPEILSLRNVTKVYANGSRTLTVLHEVSLSIVAGTTCAIIGPSGSGKTTLLGLCAGLDRPTSGEVYVDGQLLNGLSEDGLAAMRNRSVGFVFQSFQLLPTLTALENVMVPLELRGDRQAHSLAAALLERVGLGDRLQHYPAQLSGGEQQRIAIARAFIHQPRILFADEPTGNLDDDTSAQIIQLLFTLNQEVGTTLVLVTHDAELAQRTQRIIRLRGGCIVDDWPLRCSDQIGESINRGNGDFRNAISHSSSLNSPAHRFSGSSKEKRELDS